jgi:hypothetical protein
MVHAHERHDAFCDPGILKWQSRRLAGTRQRPAIPQVIASGRDPLSSRPYSSLKLVATYGEARTNLTFRLPDAIVQKALPSGWLPSPFTSGPSKGANLTVTFMDWLTVQEPDGTPGKTYRSVGVSVPAKRNGSDATVSMSITGLSSPSGYAPGPYGNSLTAKSTIARTLRTDGKDVSTAEEVWHFEAESGDSIQLELQFVRGVAARSKLQSIIHSAVNPDFYRIYRVEQAVDVIRSTDGTDRVQRYFFKASGPFLSRLFNGSEQLISITSLPWFSRQAFLPVFPAE